MYSDGHIVVKLLSNDTENSVEFNSKIVASAHFRNGHKIIENVFLFFSFPTEE